MAINRNGDGHKGIRFELERRSVEEEVRTRLEVTRLKEADRVIKWVDELYRNNGGVSPHFVTGYLKKWREYIEDK